MYVFPLGFSVYPPPVRVSKTGINSGMSGFFFVDPCPDTNFSGVDRTPKTLAFERTRLLIAQGKNEEENFLILLLWEEAAQAQLIL